MICSTCNNEKPHYRGQQCKDCREEKKRVYREKKRAEGRDAPLLTRNLWDIPTANKYQSIDLGISA